MDARRLPRLVAAVTLLCLGASHRTPHFLIDAPTDELAREIGQYAEHYRRTLAVEWLGRELPPWSGPCPIRANVSPHLGAGGATQFYFQGQQPCGWAMTIQGSRERILDSVLPHEITHTIFATHFGRPLPRWADEGACTMVEHASERRKQEQLLIRFLTNNQGIAFNKMFQMMEYPPDMLPLYSQGYALAQFFIAQGGKQKFVQYVGEGMQTNNWTAATRKHYGYESLSELQLTWVEWIRHGRQVPVPAAFVKATFGSPALASATPAPASAAGSLTAPVAAAPESGALVALEHAPRKDGLAPQRQEPSPAWVASNAEPRTVIEPVSLATVAASEPSRDGGTRYAPGSTARVGLMERTVTRPQPLGQPQQQVLEWERSPTSDARIPASAIYR